MKLHLNLVETLLFIFIMEVRSSILNFVSVSHCFVYDILIFRLSPSNSKFIKIQISKDTLKILIKDPDILHPRDILRLKMEKKVYLRSEKSTLAIFRFEIFHFPERVKKWP
jgi:hypothetical protein